ncbi:MAG: DinB family protein [Pirellulales bacterium]
MATLDVLRPAYDFNRQRTLGLLDKIAGLPDPQAALAFRPGPGRAHIGWQLLHIAVTEDIFATERLAPEKTGRFADLWPRFRGGSTPDDDVPGVDLIRQVLDGARAELLATLADYPESRLDEIPPTLAQRGWRVRDALNVIAWHEPHHQGQAHLTLNVFLAK